MFFPEGYIPADATQIFAGCVPVSYGFNVRSLKVNKASGGSIITNASSLTAQAIIHYTENTENIKIGIRGCYIEEFVEGRIYDAVIYGERATDGVRLIQGPQALEIHITDNAEGWKISSDTEYGLNGTIKTGTNNGDEYIVFYRPEVNKIVKQLISITWTVNGAASSGAMIENITWNNDRLVITLTDGTSVTSPPLTGPKGDDGEQGPQGIQGETGPQGPPGQDAQLPTGQSGDILLYGSNGWEGSDRGVLVPGTTSNKKRIPRLPAYTQAGSGIEWAEDTYMQTPTGGNNGDILQKTVTGYQWSPLLIEPRESAIEFITDTFSGNKDDGYTYDLNIGGTTFLYAKAKGFFKIYLDLDNFSSGGADTFVSSFSVNMNLFVEDSYTGNTSMIVPLYDETDPTKFIILAVCCEITKSTGIAQYAQFDIHISLFPIGGNSIALLDDDSFEIQSYAFARLGLT